jgi:hypothetical protein
VKTHLQLNINIIIYNIILPGANPDRSAVMKPRSSYLSILYVLSICLSVAVQPFVGPWLLFQFLDLLHSRYDSLPFASPLPTHGTTQTQNKRTQTSMPQVGFEPTMSVFGGLKTVYVSDRAASMPDLYI